MQAVQIRVENPCWTHDPDAGWSCFCTDLGSHARLQGSLRARWIELLALARDWELSTICLAASAGEQFHEHLRNQYLRGLGFRVWGLGLRV